MDIGNLSNTYADMLKTQTSQTTSKLENQLGTDYSKASDEELMNVCKEFEAYFVEQMYKGMLKTIPESEKGSVYTEGMMDFYRDNMIREIASDSAEQNSLGLAQMLYEQMKRNYNL